MIKVYWDCIIVTFSGPEEDAVYPRTELDKVQEKYDYAIRFYSAASTDDEGPL